MNMNKKSELMLMGRATAPV